MLLIYISLCPFHGVPLYCTMRSAQHTVLSIVFCMRSQYRKARPKSVPAGHVRGDSVPGWPTGVRVAPLASTRGAPAGRPGQPARAAGLTRAVAATRPSPPPVPPPPPPRRPAAQPASTVTFAAAATALPPPPPPRTPRSSTSSSWRWARSTIMVYCQTVFCTADCSASELCTVCVCAFKFASTSPFTVLQLTTSRNLVFFSRYFTATQDVAEP